MKDFHLIIILSLLSVSMALWNIADKKPSQDEVVAAKVQVIQAAENSNSSEVQAAAKQAKMELQKIQQEKQYKQENKNKDIKVGFFVFGALVLVLVPLIHSWHTGRQRRF
ncbi:hypothetical protein ACFBZI_12040 [Moraxella sp. ZJ142]|uniref:hypothetical protein n=1 Tax=Moraxella marmotae TaxID=3344520 RepID=UPI0035D3E9B1